MNEIILAGIIRNIKYSHTIKDVEYWQAEIITTTTDGNKFSDIVPIKFKKFSNMYNEDDFVFIKGNIRSFSRRGENGKNSVQLYVFTYFDMPSSNEFTDDNVNRFVITGSVCKTEPNRKTKSGKDNKHFIIANNIASGNNKKINNFLPSVAWGSLAKNINDLKVNDKIKCTGKFHSRTYTKTLEDGSVEFNVANELVVDSLEILQREEDKR